jgi:hypothetical protein
MQQSRPSRLRSALAVVAASALLVTGVATVSEAAGAAKSVLLGKNNKAKKTTKITNKKAKPALALKSKSGPALSVNTDALVKNLNADLLDGKTLDQVSPTRYTATIFTAGGTVPADLAAVSSTSIPGGTYEVSVNGLFSVSTGESVTCQMADYTQLLANPADLRSILLTAIASGDADSPNLGDSRIVSIVGGHQYIFICSGTAGVEIAQPGQFVLEAVDRVAAVPGQSPFTPKPGEAADLPALR